MTLYLLPCSRYNTLSAKEIKPDPTAMEFDSLKVNSQANEISTRHSKANSTPMVVSDTVPIEMPVDTVYKPDPAKAIWYSALFPGLGQLYNHRYWKLPIVGAGFAALTYAIGWNNKYYVAYTNGYRDFTDNDPDTNSFMDLLPQGSTYYKSSNFSTVLKNRQQSYRRSRDLSIIGAVGVYLICILDAYVDAQMYDFDISPDLSLQPSFQPSGHSTGFLGTNGVELSLSLRF